MESGGKRESSGTLTKTGKDMKLRRSSFKLKQAAHEKSGEKSRGRKKSRDLSRDKSETPTSFLRKESKVVKTDKSKDKSTTPILRRNSSVAKDASVTVMDDIAMASKSNMRLGDSSASIFVDPTQVETLKKMLKRKRLKHHMSDLELNRWLIQKKLNVRKTVTAIEAHLEWRKEMNIDELIKEPLDEDIQRQEDSNVFLILPDTSADPQGRPIIICCPIKHLNHCEMGKVDVKKFIIYNQEKITVILDRLHSQNFTAFLDLKGCKTKHVDYGLAKELGQLVRTHYPERLGKLYVINYPYFYHVIWYVVKAWISKKTQSKIKFLDAKKIDLAWAIENEKIPDTFVWK